MPAASSALTESDVAAFVHEFGSSALHTVVYRDAMRIAQAHAADSVQIQADTPTVRNLRGEMTHIHLMRVCGAAAESEWAHWRSEGCVK